MSDGRRYQTVAATLRQMLARGRWRIGDRLPPERLIAEELEVPRATVREAMIMLEIEHLLEVRRGSGVYVLALPGTTSPAFGPPGDIGPFELLQARQLIESQIAGLAATQVGKSDILAMQEALDQEAQEIAAGRGTYEGDAAFHRLIAEATQNGALIATVDALWAMREGSALWRRLHTHVFDQTYRRRWLDDHAAILTALKRRDRTAAQAAMSRHLDNVRATLLELSEPDELDFDAFLFGRTTPSDTSTP